MDMNEFTCSIDMSEYLEELREYLQEMINNGFVIKIGDTRYDKVELKGFYDEFGLRFSTENNVVVFYSVVKDLNMEVVRLVDRLSCQDIYLVIESRINFRHLGTNPVVSYVAWDPTYEKEKDTE